MKNHQQNMPILARIQTLKGEHPFWGYRRVWAYLRYREHLDVAAAAIKNASTD
jgi:hypothetical protein